MTRSLVRPLTRSLTRSLLRGPSLDADAAAYIDALVSGGATVTSVQSDAIDTFIRAEKAGERWDLIKRLYLPIWELAAPNAICMRSLTSGTFVNAITHAAGYIRTDSTISYLKPDDDAKLTDIGVTASSAHLMMIRKQKGTEGTQASGTRGPSVGQRFFVGLVSDFNEGRGADTARIVNEATNTEGVLIFNIESKSLRRLIRGGEIRATDTGTSSENIPNILPFFGALNDSGTPSIGSSSAEYGGFSVGLGMTGGQATSYSDNLKTLWETCTPHTLP